MQSYDFSSRNKAVHSTKNNREIILKSL